MKLAELLKVDVGNINDLYTSSGLEELDITAGGARYGLNLILAASGRGKSMISLYSALELAKDENNAVLYLSLENSERTDIHRIQHKFIDSNEYKGDFEYKNAKFEDVNIDTIINTIKQYRLDNPDKNIYTYIDSIDFIHFSGDAAAMFNQYGAVAAILTGLARTEQVTIITTQQLNRSASDKGLEEQTYYMIQQSIGIAQKASVIIIADMLYVDPNDRKQSESLQRTKQTPSYKIDKLRDGPKEGSYGSPNFICPIKDLKKKLSR